MRITITAIAVAFVSACSTAPTGEQVAQADYGFYPENYEVIVRNYYNKTLKDPESVKYQGITSPQKYWVSKRFQDTSYGYLVCVTLNAKNSYGGYVGYNTDGILIKNGSIIQVFPKGMWGIETRVC